MKKVFHPYTEWECYKNGMWDNVHSSKFTSFLQKAIEFTGDAEIYGEWMLKVIFEWPKTCEHHLTDSSINRKAFVGHAATCLAIGCPEHITRLAWGRLSQLQQDMANQKAIEAIQKWEFLHETKNNRVCKEMGESGLSGGNSGQCAFTFRGIEQSAIVQNDM